MSSMGKLFSPPKDPIEPGAPIAPPVSNQGQAAVLTTTDDTKKRKQGGSSAAGANYFQTASGISL